MELFGAILFVALIALIGMRVERRNLFPDQRCAYCPMAIHFDFGSERWVHENGQQYAARPGQVIDHLYPGHPALPPVNGGDVL
jgi:hypothetical protein